MFIPRVLCRSLPFLQHVSPADKIHSTTKSSELTLKPSGLVSLPVLAASLSSRGCLEGPASWPPWLPSCSSITKVTCTQYRLQLSLPCGIRPPTYRLLYGTPPGLSRHKTSRVDLSLRKVQEDP